MEEVEEANRAAVQSCHRVLSVLSQPGDEDQYRNLMVETTEAEQRFTKVVSLLGTGLGHARVRKHKKLQFPFSESILLDNPNFKTDNQIQELGPTVRNSPYMGNCSLELSSNERNPLLVIQQTSSTHHDFLQQQQQKLYLQQHQQMLLSQQHQQMKHQAEMTSRRSTNAINLNFDRSTCMPSLSSSFISFTGIDGNMANLDGSAFRLLGYANSFDQNVQQHKQKFCAKGNEGSMKCGSSAKSHISKQRVKRSIKVPAISNKLADLPPDDYSWRKYGQKPIKGSPFPRAYYKCSIRATCPAKKHVERCLEEPSMLIVTYEGDHSHPKLPTQYMQI